MAFANTILAGAQKSGTTTLCRFLAGHPQCLVSEPKESNFFSRAENLSKLDGYGRYFRAVRPAHRILVDGTTTYMADPAIAPRIRENLGDDIKIIFVLRSPAARTYSSFLHMLKRGHDRRTADEVFLGLPDDPAAAAAAERAAIEEAVADGRIAGQKYRKLYDDLLWNYRYVGNSLYSSLVESYFNLFNPENILVLFFEEMVRDIPGSRQRLGEFLAVDPELFPEALMKDNATRIPNLSSPSAWLIEQVRWIKRGNLTLVRPWEITASPLVPDALVRAKLTAIFQAEVNHWSQRARRDLRALGW